MHNGQNIDEIRKVAIEAGKAIMEYYHAEQQAVEYKEDTSPLTQADRAAHDHICRRLAALTPDIPVISEESQPAEREGELTWDRFWLVDPLDGTKEFLKKTGEFTVNIGLIESGIPTVGVIHAPGIDTTYWAAGDQGAWRVEGDAEAATLKTRKADPDRLWVVASRDHAGPDVASMLERIPGHRLTSMGSSLKFCLIAEGKADLYPRFVPTMEWDTAAAQCIVESAGGKVTDAEGRPLRYRKPSLKNPGIVAVGDPDLAWKQFLP